MKKKKLLKKLLYLLLLFVVGSLIGYIYEEIFYLVEENKLVNRGVLFGPWLPIYGIGIMGIYFLKPLKKHPILMTLSLILLTSFVEYVIGFISIKFFDMRLWDYRGLFLNLDGIICFRSIATFTVGGLVFVYLIEPYLEKLYNSIGESKLTKLSVVFLIIFVADIILSIMFRNPITY